jgi:hypothetical protein
MSSSRTGRRRISLKVPLDCWPSSRRESPLPEIGAWRPAEITELIVPSFPTLNPSTLQGSNLDPSFDAIRLGVPTLCLASNRNDLMIGEQNRGVPANLDSIVQALYSRVVNDSQPRPDCILDSGAEYQKTNHIC